MRLFERSGKFSTNIFLPAQFESATRSAEFFPKKNALLAHRNEGERHRWRLARQQRRYVPPASSALIQRLTTNSTKSRIRIRSCGWSLVTGGISMKY
jgi:hypothetical protein